MFLRNNKSAITNEEFVGQPISDLLDYQKLTLKNNIIYFSTKNLEKCVADDKYQNDDNQTLSRI
jgi:hypothetical protein